MFMANELPVQRNGITVMAQSPQEVDQYLRLGYEIVEPNKVVEPVEEEKSSGESKQDGE